MSQPSETTGGLFACFGRKKEKGSRSPSPSPPPTKEIQMTSTQPDPAESSPEPAQNSVPIPSFITQVGQSSDITPLKIPTLSRETIDINSPRRGTDTERPAERDQLSEESEEKVPWRVDALLPPQRPEKQGKKCLVLDLDETLVHSSFKEVAHYDFKIPVQIEGITYQVYVAKRPGVDEFLKKMGESYEICVFTASLSKYADPVLDLLDCHKVVDWRLFRESCTCLQNTYVKDMGRMGRPITSVMIMDNSPHSYLFNPENAIPCESWFDDTTDTELLEFIPVLQEVANAEDVRIELERLKLNGHSRLLESMESSSAQSESDVCSSDDELSLADAA